MKIAFISSNNFLSKLIKWFTKSNWTHAMLILDDTVDGDSIVVEASALHGISLTLISKFANKTIATYQDINDVWDINSIKAHIGNNYGYLQLLGIGLVKLFGLRKNPFTKDQVCSELVLEWLLSTPYANEFAHLDRNLVSPEDLYKVISTSSSFTQV